MLSSRPSAAAATCSEFLASRVLIHVMPCACGSMMRGHRTEAAMMAPFSIEVRSRKTFSLAHNRRPAGVVSTSSGSAPSEPLTPAEASAVSPRTYGTRRLPVGHRPAARRNAPAARQARPTSAVPQRRASPRALSRGPAATGRWPPPPAHSRPQRRRARVGPTAQTPASRPPPSPPVRPRAPSPPHWPPAAPAAPPPSWAPPPRKRRRRP
eukprot:scaffold12691_cov108-Isochrysis_galbana.AAC.11